MKHRPRKSRRKYLIFYLRVFEDGMFMGFVMDISPAGMMVLSEFSVETGRRFRLRMNLPPDISGRGNKNYVEFDSVCRWSRSDEDNRDFFLNGFELQQADRDTCQLIDSIIKEYGRH